jgi:hypothetical protein
MKRRSKGLMATGIVLTSLGGLSLFGGVLSGMAGSLGGRCYDNGSSCSTTAVLMIVGGVIGVAVGIPLIVYGGKRVPVDPSGEPLQVNASPQWLGAPGGSGWIWRF